MPARRPPEDKALYLRLRKQGMTNAEACRRLKPPLDPHTGLAWWNGYSGAHEERKATTVRAAGRLPVPYSDLSPEAKRAWDDFGYFQRRYLGKIPLPWQIAGAETVAAQLERPGEDYTVINCPPGTGKTETFTRDIPAWLTVRNRAIRGLIGSYSKENAKAYVGALRDLLRMTHPIEPLAKDLARGRAVVPEATLVGDFGVFAPDTDELLWKREAFSVQQHGSGAPRKEATWNAFGMNSSFLGWRVDFAVWDDVYDTTQIKTIEARLAQRDWWDRIAETRLEPDGVMLLQGQRLGADDLYRYNLDKLAGTDDESEEEETPVDEETTQRKKYHHIKFKAHYEELCTGEHSAKTGAYDPKAPTQGNCLLFPGRLPYRKLSAIKRNDPSGFEVVYQQGDADPDAVLVQKIWVDGGRGDDGVEYPGCWDRWRGRQHIPEGLEGFTWSVVTADPSPTKYWAVNWWLYHPLSEQRFLIDLERKPMKAPDLLDYDPVARKFTGLLHDWVLNSKELGRPITHLVLESNAAQRFMTQYAFWRLWQREVSVQIVPHETQRNKSDAKLGVEAIAPHYAFGRVRLPGLKTDGAYFQSLHLVREVTTYPMGETNDCVMAHWFMEWNAARLARPKLQVVKKNTPPQWVSRMSKQGVG
jgi:hypothetical protein